MRHPRSAQFRLQRGAFFPGRTCRTSEVSVTTCGSSCDGGCGGNGKAPSGVTGRGPFPAVPYVRSCSPARFRAALRSSRPQHRALTRNTFLHERPVCSPSRCAGSRHRRSARARCAIAARGGPRRYREHQYVPFSSRWRDFRGIGKWRSCRLKRGLVSGGTGSSAGAVPPVSCSIRLMTSRYCGRRLSGPGPESCRAHSRGASCRSWLRICRS